MRHITCSLKPSFAHENCLIFAGIGSGLHCWQILIFTYAYALIFIHRRFGSLFWLLGVLIGSLFHKKMGPYLKAWGSLLVLEAVEMVHCNNNYIKRYERMISRKLGVATSLVNEKSCVRPCFKASPQLDFPSI